MNELHEALVIHPGDTLIVRVDHRYSMDQIKSIRVAIMNRLPQLGDVVVLTADELAVLRAEVAA